MQQMKQRVKNEIYQAYRSLPISADSRLKVRNVLFRYFPVVFKDLHAYKHWLDQRNPAPVIEPPPPVAPKTLPNADGVWEWQDYDSVRARIAQAKAEHRPVLQPDR